MSAAMKDMSGEFATSYQPVDVEKDWYRFWEESGYFRPSSDTDPEKAKGEGFTIILPPPNVTGFLHLGHALTGSVQDTLVRWHRMKGHNTLFLPGTDHAGIATQVVVEKRLKATTGQSRHDLGREKFLEEVWKYKGDNQNGIKNQLRMTGNSLDWSRDRFTMDDQCALAVKEAFTQMYKDGLIYRATRLVNWCCALQSAISDLEVEFDDVEKKSTIRVPTYDKAVQMGTLTHVAYKFVECEDEIVIATTRPETILGDVAIAVHPADERYKKYHGMTMRCPFRDEAIPLICDDVLVEIGFGTGAVKVTPAHDPNDFECGRRHNLPNMSVIDHTGNIIMPGEFDKMNRFECRKKIVEALEAKGLVRGIEGHAYRVGRCSRTGDIVEPLLMPQWFVNCESMAAKSVEAVKSGELKLIPESHNSTWFHYLNNIKPWCISRQLWWGHRIPAYQVRLNGEILGTDDWVVGRNEDEARAEAKEKFKLSDEDLAKIELLQDPDVLDTWFSSALWPFSTMGWPAKTPDMETFFPNSLLETGHDILFFWVARMVMASYHFFDKLPFKEVYLHAMVRDKDGNKMSKSRGNVIDPLDVLRGISLEDLHAKVQGSNLDAKEIPKAIKYQKAAFPNGIPECGSDALRFGLLSYTQSGKSVNLDIDRLVGYRQFCNKLWNVVRYVLFHALKDFTPPATKIDPTLKSSLPTECAWILSRLDSAVEECNRGFSAGNYDFALTTNAAYRFWLYEFCDIFLELTKPTMQLDSANPQKQITGAVLLYTVERALRMLHPMMPFLTEELWHRLPDYKNFGTNSIMVAKYPEPEGWRDERIEGVMKLVMDVIGATRSYKAVYGLTPKHHPDMWVCCQNPEVKEIIHGHRTQITTLSISGEVTAIDPSQEADIPAGCGLSVVNKDATIYLMLKGFIDVEVEIKKLNKKLAELQKAIEGTQKKMSMPNYETKVPEEVRKLNAAKLESLEAEMREAHKGVERMKSFAS